MYLLSLPILGIIWTSDLEVKGYLVFHYCLPSPEPSCPLGNCPCVWATFQTQEGMIEKWLLSWWKKSNADKEEGNYKQTGESHVFICFAAIAGKNVWLLPSLPQPPKVVYAAKFCQADMENNLRQKRHQLQNKSRWLVILWMIQHWCYKIVFHVL